MSPYCRLQSHYAAAFLKTERKIINEKSGQESLKSRFAQFEVKNDGKPWKV